MPKKSYIDKVLDGTVNSRKATARGWASKTEDEKRKFNKETMDDLMVDEKRELRFASVERFQQWKDGLSGKAADTYASYNVVQIPQKNGKHGVLVYKDLNDNQQWDDGVDRVVSYNGMSSHRSKGKKREEFSQWRVDHHEKGDTVKKFKGTVGFTDKDGDPETQSGRSLLAKVLGAAVRAAGGYKAEPGEGPGATVKHYSNATQKLWTAIKAGLLESFTKVGEFKNMYTEADRIQRARQGRPKSTPGGQNDWDKPMNKWLHGITGSRQFKVLILDWLAKGLTNEIALAWVRDGSGASMTLPNPEWVQRVMADDVTAVQTAAAELVDKFETLSAAELIRECGFVITGE